MRRLRRLLRWLFPLTRTGMALWAWRNRAEIKDWGRFASRAVQDVAGGAASRDDVVTEGRLRMTLRRNPRTKGAPVEVTVRGGVAELRGRATPEVHAAVQDLLIATPGIGRIRDEIVNTGVGGDRDRRRRRRSRR